MDKLLVAPSTDPAGSVNNIIKYAKDIEDIADFLHCDIMDGVFVDKVTFSHIKLKEIYKKTSIVLDCHLMVQNTTELLEDFILAGANIITVHFELYSDKEQFVDDLTKIRKAGILAGIAIKPKTPIESVLNFVKYCDLVLIMSVEPGKSGQIFLPLAYEKIEALNNFRTQNGLDFLIEADGGITPVIAKKLKKLGTDIVVSGNYIFSQEDRKKAIAQFKI